MHVKNDIHITKVTHGGCEFTVKTACEHGATINGAKALGGWSESGAFRPCYDRALPVDALLGAAMFNGRKPESYFVARACTSASHSVHTYSFTDEVHIDPPAELLGVLFPWVEGEIRALQERRSSNRLAIDIALWQFLHLLIWLRLVLLQDAAVLFMLYPECSIFKYAPFNTDTFRTFAARSVSQIEQAQEEARLALQNLPDNVASSVRGAITNFSLEQKREHKVNKVYREKLSTQLHHFAELSASSCRPSRCCQPNFGKQTMYIAIQTSNLMSLHSLSTTTFCVTYHPSSSLSCHLLSLNFLGNRNVELIPLCASS